MGNISERAWNLQVGDQIGVWTVAGDPFRVRDFLGSRKRVCSPYCVCRCVCGRFDVVNCRSLTRNLSRKSCVCGGRPRTSRAIHKQSNSQIYRIWCAMKCRCFNPRTKDYVDYGGRGITVCVSWLDFAPFAAWASANGYRRGLVLDRKKVMAGYSPENCRWVTPTESANNRRSNRLEWAFGEQKTVAEWARDRRCVVRENTLRNRLHLGWSMATAILTPLMQPRNSHRGVV